MTTTTPTPAHTRTNAPLVRTLAVLTATIVLTNAQIYNVIPLFPSLASDWIVSTAQLTWLSTAIAVGYTIGFVLLGPLTDRLDRRPMLVIGTAATSLTTLAVIASGGFEVGVLLRTIQGVTAAIFAPAAFVYIASRVNSRHRSLALTTVVSGALAASVVGQVGGQLLNAAYGWRSVYIVSAAALALAAVALHFLLVPDPATGAPKSLRDTYLALPRLLFRRGLAPLYAVTLTILGGFVAVYTALQVGGDASTDQLLTLRIAALPAIVGVPFVATWLARFAAHHRVAAATLLSALAAAGVALLQPGELGLAILVLVYTVGVTTSAPAINESIAGRAGAQRGAALSLFTAVLMLGASITPPLVGAAGDADPRWIFAGIAAVVAVAAITAWWNGTRQSSIA